MLTKLKTISRQVNMNRVANPYKPLMDSIFRLKRKVTVYRTEHNLFYDSEGTVPPFECCALYIPPNWGRNKHHVIQLSGPQSDNLEKYLGNLTHEYVHAWQHEKGIESDDPHDEKSQYIRWEKYLKKYYGITI
jgi:hypothetical protein